MKKAFSKIQHQFSKDTLNKFFISEYLSIITAIYCKLTFNVVFILLKLKTFPLLFAMGQGYHLPAFLFNIVHGILATAIKCER